MKQSATFDFIDKADNVAVATAAGHLRNRQRERRAEQREFQITLYAFFAVFLVVAALTWPLPARWRPFASNGDRRSIIGEARTAAHEVTPFIFMR